MSADQPDDAPVSRLSLPLRLLLAPLRVLVTAIVLLDEIARPLYQPIARWFSTLRLIKRAEAVIAGLPPYAILFVLAVPLVGVEPLKLLALYWMGTGRIVTGAILLVFAYAASFLIVERIYHAGEAGLMRIGWFAAIMRVISRIRAAVLDWVKSTRSWAFAMHVVGKVRALRAALVRRFWGRPSQP